MDDLIEGSYKVVLKKNGYPDWGKILKVTEGDTINAIADLKVITAVPTTIPTTVPAAEWTTVPTAMRTTRVSTITVPTPWPSAKTTEASPVDPAVTMRAAGLGLGLAVLRKL